MATNLKKNAVCSTCTLKLVRLAYRRRPLFRAVREPLKLGMRLFSWIHRVDPEEYQVRTPACRRCIRFHKVALKEKSALFRWLNNQINPLFDEMLERIDTEEDLRQARSYGRSASDGNVSPEAADDWMEGQKPGF